jgi:hypothetical protein
LSCLEINNQTAKFSTCQKLFNNAKKCEIFLTLVSFFKLFIMSARNVVNYSHLDCSRSASTYQDADLGLTGVFFMFSDVHLSPEKIQDKYKITLYS